MVALIPLERDEERFLVAPYGEVDWSTISARRARRD